MVVGRAKFRKEVIFFVSCSRTWANCYSYSIDCQNPAAAGSDLRSSSLLKKELQPAAVLVLGGAGLTRGRAGKNRVLNLAHRHQQLSKFSINPE